MNQTIEKPATPHSWPQEVRELLSWVKDNALLCAAAAIALPGISVFHYTQYEHVPISITSSEMLAALPVVLSVILLTIIILCAAMLMPLSAMFESAKRAPDGRWHLLPSREGGRRKSALLWLAALAVPGIILATAATFSSSSSKNDRWPMWLAMILSAAFYTWITQWTLPGRTHKHTLDSLLFTAFMGGFCQMLLIMTTMQLTLHALNPELSSYWIYASLIGTTFGLALVQLFFAALIETTSTHAGVVKQACTATAALVAVLCAFPYTGAWLAGYVISGSASGGADCVQLTISTEASDFNALLAPGNERKTQGVRLLANVDSTYFVRKQREARGTVYRIPAEKVTALTACPSTKNNSTQNK